MSENNVRYRKRIIRRQYKPDHNNNNNTNEESFTMYNNAQQQQQQHRPGYLRKKPEGLICSICSGPAHGYNFDTITCESCKAFFRRNALRADRKFKCRSGDGQCVIVVSTRKRCKACRLAKCFEKGMRADWILTEEERLNKKRKIEENRRLRQMLYPDSNSDEGSHMEFKTEPFEDEDEDEDEDIQYSSYVSPSLSSEDLMKIDQIQRVYADSVRLTSLPSSIPSYPHTAHIQAAWDMMNLPTNLQSTRLITFFKFIPEFTSLNEHDKLILIKYNTFTLVFIRSTLIYDRIKDQYHDTGTNDCIFDGKDLIQCFSLHQYQQSTRCVCRLIDASQNDHLIIKMLLLITLFSKGLSICAYIREPEPIAEDIYAIYRAQNIFIDLLWKYCEQKFGFIKTVSIWVRCVTGIIDAHLQAYNTQYNFVKNDAVAEQLVPLMKAVMLNV